MLAGIFNRWKIPVAHYFTSDDVNGAILKPIVENIIQKTESIGLFVHSVTTDMGPINLAMWKAFGGIGGDKNTEIRHFIIHPVDKKRTLMFIADAPHLLKNLKASILNNKIIELPMTFVQTHNLSQPIVKFQHLNKLIDIQENFQLKLIPKVKKQDLTCTTFNKMKVGKAKNILSRDVSSAIKFYGKETGNTEFKTTAELIEVISKWFTLITARIPKLALGKTSHRKGEIKYKKNIAFLHSVVELIRNINIGYKKTFKPVQKGIMITTTSIIELTNYLLNKRGYKYVLGSRFSQDCIENLFSLIRAKNPTPNALQFQQNLKLIIISQYFKSLDTSNYEKDEGEVIDVLNTSPKKESVETEQTITLTPKNNIIINDIELNILYNTAGYIITSIIKCNKICVHCLQSVGSYRYDPQQKYSMFVYLRRFRKNTLFFLLTMTLLNIFTEWNL